MNVDPQRLLAAILKTATDAIITIDGNQRIVIFNAGAEAVFGYSAEEIVGRKIDILLPKEMRDRHRQFVTSFVSGSQISRMMRERKDLIGQRKDGTVFDAEASIAKIDENGETTATVILRDIGARKLMEKQLRQVQKIEAMGQLTGGIAHEFNNLLLVILGNIEMMQEGLDADNPLHRYLSPMLTSATRGADLTQNLLSFSRHQKLEVGHVDLNEIVRRTEELLERTLDSSVRIITKTTADLWLTSADSGQIEAALLNLALNSRDAMPNGGTITVRTANITVTGGRTSADLHAAGGDYVVLEVADTGTGMAKDILEQVFDPFFTTKEVGKGTGLGLSVVHGFVKQSGGFVHIESAPEEGTTVRLGFPREVTPDTVEQEPPRASGEATKGSGTILVVEDAREVRELVVNQLSDLGYTVLEADDGPGALTILADHPEIAVIFSDVVLPQGLSGPELARKAQELRPGLTVLLTSGYPNRRSDDLHLDDVGIPVLAKPYQKFELAEFIARNME